MSFAPDSLESRPFSPRQKKGTSLDITLFGFSVSGGGARAVTLVDMPLKRLVSAAEGPGERPFRWSDLWRVFLPLFPWIAIALAVYFVIRVGW
jgi:hypothetical protein